MSVPHLLLDLFHRSILPEFPQCRREDPDLKPSIPYSAQVGDELVVGRVSGGRVKEAITIGLFHTDHNHYGEVLGVFGVDALF